MRKLTAKQVRSLTAAIDQAAEYLEKGAEELGLPKKLALQCAYRLDKVADRIETPFRQAAMRRQADVLQHDEDEWYDMFYDWAGDQGPSDHLHVEPDEEYYMENYRDDTGAEMMKRHESPVKGIGPWGKPFNKQPSQHNVDDTALRTYEGQGSVAPPFAKAPWPGAKYKPGQGGATRAASQYERYQPVTHAGAAAADEDLL